MKSKLKFPAVNSFIFNLFVVVNLIGEVCKRKIGREKVVISAIEKLLGIGSHQEDYE